MVGSAAQPYHVGRISVYMFAGSLSVDVDIRNVGKDPLEVDPQIRELARLRKMYGAGRWRKLKGAATVRLPDGSTVRAEVHWYERHGLDRCEMKIKRFLGDDE